MIYNGGCEECGGVCQDPFFAMNKVFQGADKGKITGGQVANMLLNYAGNGIEGEGFFGDLWDGIKTGLKTVASVAKPVLSFIPHPAAQAAAIGLNALGVGRRRRRKYKRRL